MSLLNNLNQYRFFGGAECECNNNNQIMRGGGLYNPSETIRERERQYNENREILLRMRENRSLEDTKNKPIKYYLEVGRRKYY